MRKRTPLPVFLDANILRFGVTHYFGTVPETVKWGDREVTGELAALLPRKKRSDWLQAELDVLPKVAALARANRIACWYSREINRELMSLRYGGMVQSELSLWHGIEIRECGEPLGERAFIIAPSLYKDYADDQRNEFLENARKRDPEYDAFCKALGEGREADAYHVFTAHRAGIKFFLTCDGKLRDAARRAGAPLPVSIVLPSELLQRVHSRTLSGRMARAAKAFRPGP